MKSRIPINYRFERRGLYISILQHRDSGLEWKISQRFEDLRDTMRMRRELANECYVNALLS